MVASNLLVHKRLVAVVDVVAVQVLRLRVFVCGRRAIGSWSGTGEGLALSRGGSCDRAGEVAHFTLD